MQTGPSQEQRFESYYNYCNLFNFILSKYISFTFLMQKWGFDFKTIVQRWHDNWCQCPVVCASIMAIFRVLSSAVCMHIMVCFGTLALETPTLFHEVAKSNGQYSDLFKQINRPVPCLFYINTMSHLYLNSNCYFSCAMTCVIYSWMPFK